ncbi:MAG: ribonuclease J [Clostridiales bacterium]|nr:ribonuclease J [Clostridiales bacterium]
MANNKDNTKLKVIALGGLNEIGKNMYLLEYGDDIIVIDCGIGFPDEEMLGIDLVIPDVQYLADNAEKVRGIFLTHGHEDHIGAVPYVLQSLNVPIYGTRLTIGILKNKLEEHHLPHKPILNTVYAGSTVKAGVFSVEFIRVNHSIADSCALAVKTPVGTVIETGDFKLDITPIDGEMMDLTRLGQLGKEGVLLLMSDSTNAERPGWTPSERIVGENFDDIFMKNADKRIVISTFSSNVHRVQQVIDKSVRYNRKVAITGRSMLNIVTAAVEEGYMKVPRGSLIDIGEIRRYPPEQLTLITTGSQGEPMSALYRMAFSEHDKVELGPSDLVVLSASAIPGNEKMIDKIVNELCKKGASVFRDAAVDVHVSGHACQEELKLMMALTKPKFFMPVHGEYRHMQANRDNAMEVGIQEENIFITDVGRVLELDESSCRDVGTVPSGRVLVDGYGVGDVGSIVLRDRKHLAQDGLIVVVATVDIDERTIISGPDIVSRGFVYMREAEEMMDQVRVIARDTLQESLDVGITDWTQLKTNVKDDMQKFLFQRTKRNPMILPVVMNV